MRELNWSNVTPKPHWLNRRQLLAGGAALLASPAVARIDAAKSGLSTDAAPNTFSEITTYNNFYEFGLDKGDPARNARLLTTDPWAIEISGLVDRPGSYDLADILQGAPLEERIYRFRCVEAWSRLWCARRKCRGKKPARWTGPIARG